MVPLLLLLGLDQVLFNVQFLLDTGDQQVVQFFLPLPVSPLPGILLLELSLPTEFLLIDLVLSMVLSLLFPLVHEIQLSPLHVIVLIQFFPLSLDHPLFLLDLSVQFPLHLPLLLLFSDGLEFLFLLVEFLVELDDSGPLIIFVSQFVETLLLPG